MLYRGQFEDLPNGQLAPTLLECWRDLKNYSGRAERCYDLVGSDFPRSEDRRLNSTVTTHSMCHIIAGGVDFDGASQNCEERLPDGFGTRLLYFFYSIRHRSLDIYSIP